VPEMIKKKDLDHIVVVSNASDWKHILCPVGPRLL